MVMGGVPQNYAYCQPLLSGSSKLRMGWTLASDAKVRPWLCSLQAYTDLPCHAPPPLCSCPACAPWALASSNPGRVQNFLQELKPIRMLLMHSALHELLSS